MTKFISSNSNDTKSRIKLYSEVALLVGLVLNGLAVTLMIKSGLGVSTISSIPLILDLVSSKLTLGMTTFLFQLFLMAILFVVTRKIGQYVISLGLAALFSIILEFYSRIFDGILINGIARYLIFLVGFILLAFGITLMIMCKLPPLPFDIFIRDMALISKKKVRTVKTIFDATCVLSTILISYVNFKSIYSVGIGTIFAMVFTGSAIQWLIDLINRYIIFVPRAYTKFIYHNS
ncbi:DUF6198 family protein [Maledivibacter halophilus]|uniref:Uncharacterized membrane protein YczE n=1 Tax=Maledivibacter halophilus TaxID=36842 RepID=A0A1T5MW91_9FIRM|nr:DUF6198 family protein [Maledivibacter halophilus]SKC92344.1 Uncharacterized membrane protein YczE [Maledivibacter halophilus]